MESIERNGAAGAAVAPLRVVAAAADGTKVRPPASFESMYGAYGRDLDCYLAQSRAEIALSSQSSS